jgi:hypothetical protein
MTAMFLIRLKPVQAPDRSTDNNQTPSWGRFFVPIILGKTRIDYVKLISRLKDRQIS